MIHAWESISEQMLLIQRKSHFTIFVLRHTHENIPYSLKCLTLPIFYVSFGET
jgi:hypothetical protein